MRRYIILALAIVAIIAAVQVLPAEANTSTDYGWIKQDQIMIAATTAGGLGAGAGSGDTDAYVRGHIYAIHLAFEDGLPLTTDVTVTATDPALTILTITDSITDTWYYPVAVNTSNVGAALTAYDRLPVNSRIHVAIAQTYPITGYNTITATILWGQ